MKNKLYLLTLTLFFMFTSSSLFCLNIGGTVRNNFFSDDINGEYDFTDILTTEIFVEHSTTSWRSYSSIELQSENGNRTTFLNSNRFAIKSSYLSYYGKLGQISLGKSYIDFGNRGLFNPFTIDKTIKINELNYKKEGIINGSLYVEFSRLTSLNIYLGPRENRLQSGMLLSTTYKDYDTGFIFVHNHTNHNKAGIFLKGNLLVNIYLAAATHFENSFGNKFLETTSKIDYNFKNFYLEATWYYNQKGATSASEYEIIAIRDVYLLARNYLFFQLTFKHSEKISFSLYHFYNINDKSGILTGKMNFNLANGMKSILQISAATGKNETEFSAENFGVLSLFYRIEGKF